ncbi:MAG: DUF5658 family protein [Syntrophobacteraceae bacterium]
MDENEMTQYASRERRSGKERREKPTVLFSRSSLFGSRRKFRRAEDARKYFIVDIYNPFLVSVIIFTLILCVADAFLTLKLISENFQELNPIMDFFLKLGPLPFIMVKFSLTGFGMTTLLILNNYYLWQGRIKIGALLLIFPFFYLLLVIYEIIMVRRL